MRSFSPHTGHLYAHVQHASLTWAQARAEAGDLSCCGAPGHLVTVGDGFERDFVEGTVSGPGQYGWIGLNDIATEGTYLWTDGTTLDPSVLVPQLVGESAEADCGYYESDGSTKWEAHPCDYVWQFSIVEFDCPTTASDKIVKEIP